MSTAPCRLQGLEDTAVKICKDYGPDKIAALADKYRQVLNSPDIITCCYVDFESFALCKLQSNL